MLNFIDYYKLFGVSFDASFEEIKDAYENKISEINDKLSLLKDDSEDAKKLNRLLASLNVGYNTLSKPESRKFYDKMYRDFEIKNVEIDIDKALSIVKNRKSIDEISKNNEVHTDERSASERIFDVIGDINVDSSFQYDEEKEMEELFGSRKKVNNFKVNKPTEHKKNIFDTLDDSLGEKNFDTKPKLKLIKFPKEPEPVDDDYFHEIIDDEYLTPTLSSIEKNKLCNKLKLYNVKKFFEMFNIDKRTVLVALSGILIFTAIKMYNDKDNDSSNLDLFISEDSVEPTVSTLEDYTNPNDTVILYNIYTVLPNDTLDDISIRTNKSVAEIKSYNENINGDNIYVGDKLVLPYIIRSKDLDSFSIKAVYDQSMDIYEFAKLFDTNFESLLTLNPDSIVKIDNKYVCISDEIYVPYFDNLVKNKIYNKTM